MNVVDRAGEKIGSVEAAFLDERDQHEYVAVRRGLAGLIPGTGSTLIPMDLADRVDNNRRTIEVSADKDEVKDSPSANTSGGYLLSKRCKFAATTDCRGGTGKGLHSAPLATRWRDQAALRQSSKGGPARPLGKRNDRPS